MFLTEPDRELSSDAGRDASKNGDKPRLFLSAALETQRDKTLGYRHVG
jgi:hypothetical protein